MDNLTKPCRCVNPECKDLKLEGDNEFWIKAKPDGTHCTWAYCNACFSRFHLDGTNELVGGNVWVMTEYDGDDWVMTEYDGDDPCNFCTGDPDAMAQVQTWREANA